MGTARRQEERALDKDERALVEKTRHPAIRELSDSALRDLVKLVRDRRDKAKTQDYQHRRDVRGRAVTASPASDGLGSRRKVSVLAAAMRRVNDETKRRRAGTDDVSPVQQAAA